MHPSPHAPRGGEVPLLSQQPCSLGLGRLAVDEEPAILSRRREIRTTSSISVIGETVQIGSSHRCPGDGDDVTGAKPMILHKVPGFFQRHYVR